jgi:antitoxin (DNA-binding transcriptional repressor) of toxin-antitoxin stability system
MKTATVRDLRNRFAGVAKWIEEGERVAITRHGATFATLSPASTKKLRDINWAKRLAKNPAAGRKSTKSETVAFWKALRD